MKTSLFFDERNYHLNRLLIKYREQAGCSSTPCLSETDLQNIFIVMIDQFLNESLVFDDFSKLCEKLSGFASALPDLRLTDIYTCFQRGTALNGYLQHHSRYSVAILEDLLSYWRILKTQREGS